MSQVDDAPDHGEGARRGPYAKGVAKRQEILREALAAYAESGGPGPSLKTIATRAGLSERGLLHYFTSRDELLIAVLAARDAEDREAIGDGADVEALTRALAHAAQTPGLVRLFVEMSAASSDESHAAHAFFTRRYAVLSRRLAELLDLGDEGEWAARTLIAASDGLQVQWLLDPRIDLRGDIEKLADVVLGALRSRRA